jgi:hypothetical protein
LRRREAAANARCRPVCEERLSEAAKNFFRVILRADARHLWVPEEGVARVPEVWAGLETAEE